MADMKIISATSAHEAIAENPPLAVGLVCSLLSELPKEEVLATLCTAIDSFLGEWEMSKEECIDTWRHLAETAEMGYELLGVMPSSRKVGDR